MALGVVFILIIMTVNLRGIKESGRIFAVPTYLFIASFLVMIIVGIVHAGNQWWSVARYSTSLYAAAA